VRRGAQLVTLLDSGPKVSGHRPSADVMFQSLAATCGSRTVGVIMTGMGRDGADGMAALARAGGKTIGQDQASCYVYGMPKAAAEDGALQHVVSAERIPATVAGLMQNRSATAVGGR
jgi:two-component system chemotaxis response regulator CheB